MATPTPEELKKNKDMRPAQASDIFAPEALASTPTPAPEPQTPAIDPEQLRADLGAAQMQEQIDTGKARFLNAAAKDTPITIRPQAAPVDQQGLDVLRQAAGAPLVGQQKPIYAKATTTTVNKAITPALYSKEEAQQLAQAYDEQKQREAALKQQKENATEAIREAMSAQSEALQLEADKGDLRSRQAKHTLDKLRAEMANIEQSIQKAKIDPDRLVKSMSGGERALNKFAIFLGALGEGLTHGAVKNVALKLFNDAINRDIAAQKSELAKKMQAAGMKRNAIRAAMVDFNASIQDRKDAMRALYAVRLAKEGLDQKDVQAAEQYNRAALALAEKKVDVKAKARKRISKTISSTTRKVPMMPKLPKNALAKADPATRRRVLLYAEKMDKGLMQIDKLSKMLAKASYFTNAAKKIPNTLAADIGMLTKDLALFHRDAMGDSGPITKHDIKMFDRIGAGELVFKPTMARRLRAYKRFILQSKARTIRSLFTTDEDLARQGIEAMKRAQTLKPMKAYKKQ